MTENPIDSINNIPYTDSAPIQHTSNELTDKEFNLVERLNIVKLNIFTKLSEGEMCNKDYNNFLYSQLQKQEFFSKDISYDSSNFLKVDQDTKESPIYKLVYFKTQFIKILNLQTVEGFNTSYIVLPSTPLKEETQNDLVDYDNIVQQTMSYILNDLNGTIPQSKYIDSIFEFVKNSTIEKGVLETQGTRLSFRVALQLDDFKENIKFIEDPKKDNNSLDSAFDYLNER